MCKAPSQFLANLLCQYRQKNILHLLAGTHVRHAGYCLRFHACATETNGKPRPKGEFLRFQDSKMPDLMPKFAPPPFLEILGQRSERGPKLLHCLLHGRQGIGVLAGWCRSRGGTACHVTCGVTRCALWHAQACPEKGCRSGMVYTSFGDCTSLPGTW